MNTLQVKVKSGLRIALLVFYFCRVVNSELTVQDPQEAASGNSVVLKNESYVGGNVNKTELVTVFSTNHNFDQGYEDVTKFEVTGDDIHSGFHSFEQVQKQEVFPIPAPKVREGTVVTKVYTYYSNRSSGSVPQTPVQTKYNYTVSNYELVKAQQNTDLLNFVTHYYYRSVFVGNFDYFSDYWNSVTKGNPTGYGANAVKLSFTFPFYDRYLTDITVNSKGFLHFGLHVQDGVAATQYIAPFMANFDIITPQDSILIYDDGEKFTVLWEKVHFEGDENIFFTFAVTLYKNGDIVFGYKDVPLPIPSILKIDNNFKIGISDSYNKENEFDQYRQLTFNNYDVTSNTMLWMAILPPITSNFAITSNATTEVYGVFQEIKGLTENESNAQEKSSIINSVQHTINPNLDEYQQKTGEWTENAVSTTSIITDSKQNTYNSYQSSREPTFEKNPPETFTASIITQTNNDKLKYDDFQQTHDFPTIQPTTTESALTIVSSLTERDNDAYGVSQNTSQLTEINKNLEQSTTSTLTETEQIISDFANESTLIENKSTNTVVQESQYANESEKYSTTNFQKTNELIQKSHDFNLDKQESYKNTESNETSFDILHKLDLSNQTTKAEENAAYPETYHSFYKSIFNNNKTYCINHWTDIIKSKPLAEKRTKNTRHHVHLIFDFPFYGHILRNITVSRQGYIYTGDQDHIKSDTNQYIAPLKANFNTKSSDHSDLKLYEEDDKFTALWENSELDYDIMKIFTFAVTLYKNGDIIFAYKDIPIPVQNISDSDIPVRVGISDSYNSDNILRQVSFLNYNITSGSVIKMSVLPPVMDNTFEVPNVKHEDPTISITNLTNTLYGISTESNSTVMFDTEIKTKNTLTFPESLNNRKQLLDAYNHTFIEEHKEFDVEQKLSVKVPEDNVTIHITKLVTDKPIYLKKVDSMKTTDNTSINTTHSFYRSMYINDPTYFSVYWATITNSEPLAETSRRSSRRHVKLNFDFPFYGHVLRNISVSRQGFIDTGDHTQRKSDSTQYIAPLKANFVKRSSSHGALKLYEDEYKFTALWEDFVLEYDKEKVFTFAVTLYKNGDIILAYKNLPIPIPEISESGNSVVVGISDTYLSHNSLRKISFLNYNITSNTLIKMVVLPPVINEEVNIKKSDLNPEITADKTIMYDTTTEIHSTMPPIQTLASLDAKQGLLMTMHHNNASIDNVKNEYLFDTVYEVKPKLTNEKSGEKQNLTYTLHNFYSSIFINDQKHFNDHWTEITKSELLAEIKGRSSQRHVMLTFDFPFYGEILRNISVSRFYGFIDTSDNPHRDTPTTRYIAPLMANLSKQASNLVKLYEDDNKFTALWEDAKLVAEDHDKITFAVTMYKNGDIIFAYKKIPAFLQEIYKVDHLIKVGISDTYLSDSTSRQISFVNYNISSGCMLKIVISPLTAGGKYETVNKSLEEREKPTIAKQITMNTGQMNAKLDSFVTLPKDFQQSKSDQINHQEPLEISFINTNMEKKQVEKFVDNTVKISEITDSHVVKAALDLDFLEYTTHNFYKSAFIKSQSYFDSYWADITRLEPLKEVRHRSTRRRAALTFDFPFYGHVLRNISVTRRGFIDTSDIGHKKTATQYIAPLMTNFDLKSNVYNTIKLYDDGDKFTAIWEKVKLQNDNDNEFTFAATLFKNGDIIFAYKNMPITIQELHERGSQVQVGISDTYFINNMHRQISFNNYNLTSGSILKITILPPVIKKKYETFNTASYDISEDVSLSTTTEQKVYDESTSQDFNMFPDSYSHIGIISKETLDTTTVEQYASEDYTTASTPLLNSHLNKIISDVSQEIHDTTTELLNAEKTNPGQFQKSNPVKLEDSADSLEKVMPFMMDIIQTITSTEDDIREITYMPEYITTTSDYDQDTYIQENNKATLSQFSSDKWSLLTANAADEKVKSNISYTTSDILTDQKIDRLPVSNQLVKAEHILGNLQYVTHVFYNTTFINNTMYFNNHWIDVTNSMHLKETGKRQSHHHDRAVKISFDFPFFDRVIHNITIFNEGFIKTGEQQINDSSLSQYIAPLMAKFIDKQSNQNIIKIYDDGEKFTVLWLNVKFEHENKKFTFAMTLYKNGDITFAYKDIPLNIHQIKEFDKRTKVGISDKNHDIRYELSFNNYDIISGSVLKLIKLKPVIDHTSKKNKIIDLHERTIEHEVNYTTEAYIPRNKITELTSSTNYQTKYNPLEESNFFTTEQGIYNITSAISTQNPVSHTQPYKNIIQAQQNITNLEYQIHSFYKSVLIDNLIYFNEHWNEIKDSEFVQNTLHLHNIVELPFEFPYFGYLIRNISISEDGFIQMLPANEFNFIEQYIAPFGTNYSTIQNNQNRIKLYSNKEEFTVVWDKKLFNNENNEMLKFSLSLYSNGTIVFAYKYLPMVTKSVNKSKNWVTIGLSGFDILDDKINQISFENYAITNGTILKIIPLSIDIINSQKNKVTIPHDINGNLEFSKETSKLSLTEQTLVDYLTTEYSTESKNNYYTLTSNIETHDITENELIDFVDSSTVSTTISATKNNTHAVKLAFTESNDTSTSTMINLTTLENHNISTYDKNNKVHTTTTELTIIENFVTDRTLLYLDFNKTGIFPEEAEVSHKMTQESAVTISMNNQTEVRIQDFNSDTEKINVTHKIEQSSKMNSSTMDALSHNSVGVYIQEAVQNNDFHVESIEPQLDLNDLKYASHNYYKSVYIGDINYFNNHWTNITESKLRKHGVRRNQHRFEKSIKLPFDFPFYDRIIRNVKVTNEGFIDAGNQESDFNTSLHYIAPFMSNFKSNSQRENFQIYEDEEKFTTLWENVSLLEENEETLTFAVSLYNNGDIVFAYKNIPMTDIFDSEKTKIGISDSDDGSNIISFKNYVIKGNTVLKLMITNGNNSMSTIILPSTQVSPLMESSQPSTLKTDSTHRRTESNKRKYSTTTENNENDLIAVTESLFSIKTDELQSINKPKLKSTDSRRTTIDIKTKLNNDLLKVNKEAKTDQIKEKKESEEQNTFMNSQTNKSILMERSDDLDDIEMIENYVNHKFYKSLFINDMHYFENYWTGITKNKPLKQPGRSNSRQNNINVNLTFEFPFYDRTLRNIIVTNEGFFGVGEDSVGLTSTKYIAPLFAKFDNKSMRQSSIKVYNDSEKFTAVWENVRLQDDKSKTFTFAATIYSNGDIIFAYKDIPMSIEMISDSISQVKVGICDVNIQKENVNNTQRQISLLSYKIISGSILKLKRQNDFSNSDSTQSTITVIVKNPMLGFANQQSATSLKATEITTPAAEFIRKPNSRLTGNKKGIEIRNFSDTAKNNASKSLINEHNIPNETTFSTSSKEQIKSLVPLELPSGTEKDSDQIQTGNLIKGKQDINNLKYTNHVFYKSVFIRNSEYFNRHWESLKKTKQLRQAGRSNTRRSDIVVKLSFDFPFFDRTLQNITVVNEGFIAISNRSEQELLSMQYIAPLMISFDNKASSQSSVKLYDDGEKFTVIWENLYLPDYKTEKFTFALTLYKNGEIIFAYKNIPISISEILGHGYDVRIGVNDDKDAVKDPKNVSFMSYDITSGTLLKLIAGLNCEEDKSCSKPNKSDLDPLELTTPDPLLPISPDVGDVVTASEVIQQTSKLAENIITTTEGKSTNISIGSTILGAQRGSIGLKIKNTSFKISTTAMPDILLVSSNLNKIMETRNLTMNKSSTDSNSNINYTEKGTKRAHNLTEAVTDLNNLNNVNHRFYRSVFIDDIENFNNHWEQIIRSKPLRHPGRSNTRRGNMHTKIPFDFPFYNHTIQDIIVSNEGFINTGHEVNDLGLTWHISPLMAKFDNKTSNQNGIKMYADEEKFTVLWENVYLQEDKNKLFTFAATFYKNGDIIFAYKDIPVPLVSIINDSHGMEVGINYESTDAKTIPNDYRVISLMDYKISSGTLIKLISIPPCEEYNTCESFDDKALNKSIESTTQATDVSKITLLDSRKIGMASNKFIVSDSKNIDISNESVRNTTKQADGLITHVDSSTKGIGFRQKAMGMKRKLNSSKPSEHSILNKAELLKDISNEQNVVEFKENRNNNTSDTFFPTVQSTTVNIIDVRNKFTEARKKIVDTKTKTILKSFKNSSVADDVDQTVNVTVLSQNIPFNEIETANPISPEIITENTPKENEIKETYKLTKAEQNIDTLNYVNHGLYKSTFIGFFPYFEEHWKVITSSKPLRQAGRSNSRRSDSIVKLSFDFPYYEHIVRNIIVTNEGLINIGDNLKHGLTYTQYIAPLKGPFDNKSTSKSSIKLFDDGEKFTAVWENVYLQEEKSKKFTFAVTLYKNGNIIFAYKDIPVPVNMIPGGIHQIKIGISDDVDGDSRQISFVSYDISNGTVLKLILSQMCEQEGNCEDLKGSNAFGSLPSDETESSTRSSLIAQKTSKLQTKPSLFSTKAPEEQMTTEPEESKKKSGSSLSLVNAVNTKSKLIGNRRRLDGLGLSNTLKYKESKITKENEALVEMQSLTDTKNPIELNTNTDFEYATTGPVDIFESTTKVIGDRPKISGASRKISNVSKNHLMKGNRNIVKNEMNTSTTLPEAINFSEVINSDEINTGTTSKPKIIQENGVKEYLEAETDLSNLHYVNHGLYKSTFINDGIYFNEHWNNITKPKPLRQTGRSNTRRSDIRIKLSFDFPYYGRTIRNITVANHGTIITSDSEVSDVFASNQYIAPLMMNFDDKSTAQNSIKLYDDGEKFSVVWEKLRLHDDKSKSFTFAVTLFKNGDILFAYKDIPVTLQSILEKSHIKIGVSDNISSAENTSEISFLSYRIISGSVLKISVVSNETSIMTFNDLSTESPILEPVPEHISQLTNDSETINNIEVTKKTEATTIKAKSIGNRRKLINTRPRVLSSPKTPLNVEEKSEKGLTTTEKYTSFSITSVTNDPNNDSTLEKHLLEKENDKETPTTVLASIIKPSKINPTIVSSIRKNNGYKRRGKLGTITTTASSQAEQMQGTTIEETPSMTDQLHLDSSSEDSQNASEPEESPLSPTLISGSKSFRRKLIGNLAETSQIVDPKESMLLTKNTFKLVKIKDRRLKTPKKNENVINSEIEVNELVTLQYNTKGDDQNNSAKILEQNTDEIVSIRPNIGGKFKLNSIQSKFITKPKINIQKESKVKPERQVISIETTNVTPVELSSSYVQKEETGSDMIRESYQLTKPQDNIKDLSYVQHDSYKSVFFTDSEYFNKHWEEITSPSPLVHNKTAKFTIFPLSFDFPYYGHILRDVTVTNNGFIDLDKTYDGVHSAHYIAPLMGNFEINGLESVKIYDDENKFTVVWENLYLIQDKIETLTFAVTLYKTGEIVFAYKDFNISIQKIYNIDSAIKVGIRDSDINDKNNETNIRQISFKHYDIISGTILKLIKTDSHNSTSQLSEEKKPEPLSLLKTSRLGIKNIDRKTFGGQTKIITKNTEIIKTSSKNFDSSSAVLGSTSKVAGRRRLSGKGYKLANSASNDTAPTQEIKSETSPIESHLEIVKYEKNSSNFLPEIAESISKTQEEISSTIAENTTKIIGRRKLRGRKFQLAGSTSKIISPLVESKPDFETGLGNVEVVKIENVMSDALPEAVEAVTEGKSSSSAAVDEDTAKGETSSTVLKSTSQVTGRRRIAGRKFPFLSRTSKNTLTSEMGIPIASPAKVSSEVFRTDQLTVSITPQIVEGAVKTSGSLTVLSSDSPIVTESKNVSSTSDQESISVSNLIRSTAINRSPFKRRRQKFVVQEN